MLPILRIISVGGVLLAIAITVLALGAPDGGRSRLARVEAPARGPLLDREAHPEWRHFLIQAALRRAGELERLRELPDTPARSEPPPDAREPTLPESEGKAPQTDEPATRATDAGEEHAGVDPVQAEASVAPLPAAPVLPVEGRDVAALQQPAARADHTPAAPATPPEPTRVATLLDGAGVPMKRSDAVVLREPRPDNGASAAPATAPTLDLAAPLPDAAVFPIGGGDVADRTQTVGVVSMPAAHLSNAKPKALTLLLEDPALPVITGDIAGLQEPAVADERAAAPERKPTEAAPSPDDAGRPTGSKEATASSEPDIPAMEPEAAESPTGTSIDVAALPVDGDMGSADDETESAVDSTDGLPADLETDEAALSEKMVVLPRERPPGIIEPQQKKRPVKRHVRRARHARQVRTAANDPAAFDFFDALLRMFGANAPPPNSAISRRMTRPLY